MPFLNKKKHRSALADCAGLCGVKIKQVDAQRADKMEQYQVTRQ